MNQPLNLTRLSPLNDTDLIAAFTALPPTIYEIPRTLLAWLSSAHEDILVERMIRLMLTNDPVGVGYGIVHTLAVINPARSVDLIVQALPSATPAQQDNGLFYLHFLLDALPQRLPPTHPTIQTLLHILANPYMPERFRVVRMLSYLGTSEVYDSLTPYLSDARASIYGDIVCALIRLDGERALPLVDAILRGANADVWVRRAICEVLAEHPQHIGLDVLIHQVQYDPDADIRDIAAFALGRIGHTKAINALSGMALHDHGLNFEDCEVRRTALKAIATILQHQPEGTQVHLDAQILALLHTAGDRYTAMSSTSLKLPSSSPLTWGSCGQRAALSIESPGGQDR